MPASRIALRTALAATAALAATVATTTTASAGVTGPAFYVNGTVYRTVATPTDLSGTGAPAHSFDTIYDFGGAQTNVATAAPGDNDYNGGRWQVHALAFPGGYPAALAVGDLDGDGVLDSEAELVVALDAGTAVDAGGRHPVLGRYRGVPAATCRCRRAVNADMRGLVIASQERAARAKWSFRAVLGGAADRRVHRSATRVPRSQYATVATAGGRRLAVAVDILVPRLPTT